MNTTDLESKILLARDAYYNRQPIMSDDEYDGLVNQLAVLDMANAQVRAVGAPPPVSEWLKASHGIPMGSLDKVNELHELTTWVQSCAKGEALFVSEKLDGISIHLQYVKGKFTKGITRGDGHTGEDITTNVARMQGVPAKLPSKFTGSLRGEIVLLKSDHAEWFADYSNPRNAASGISKRYDGDGCERLTVMVYRVAEGAPELLTEEDQFQWLKSQGFFTPNHYLTAFTVGVKTPHDIWVEYQTKKRDRLNYDIDGLVVSINDMAKQIALGDKDLRPRGAVAFKFPPITRETVIRAITWQTGASGRMTPVATFDPVVLLGANVTNASLYNAKYIQTLGVAVGVKCLVARANDVIPRVVSCITPMTPEAPPATCPVCGGATAPDGEYLVCTNRLGCPAQVGGRITQWINELNVLDFGVGLVEKLVAAGKVQSIPDLYRLSVSDIASLDRLGETTATKVLANLRAKSPLPLEVFLGALGIPGVATSTIRTVMSSGLDTLEAIRGASYATLSAIPGLGPAKAGALKEFLASNAAMLDDLRSVVSIAPKVKGTLTGKTFCFTGTMSRKRADLEAMVVARGGEAKSSVTKTLSYLVSNSTDSTSAKAVAAKKNGTLCITEAEFLALCGE